MERNDRDRLIELIIQKQNCGQALDWGVVSEKKTANFFVCCY